MIIELSDCEPRIGPSGNLRFALSEALGLTYEITPWDSGFAVRATRAGRTSASHLWTLRLVRCDEGRHAPDDGLHHSPEVTRFIHDIPRQFRETLSGVGFGQAFMLSRLARHAEVRDLSESNPNLLWLIAAAVHDGEIDADQSVRLCRRSQLEVTRLLIASTSSRSTVRLLRKTRLENGTLGEARMLRHAWQIRAIVAATAHEKQVPAELLTILARYPSLVSRNVVRMLCRHFQNEQSDRHSIAARLSETLNDIDRIGVQLGFARASAAIAHCRSVEDIFELHDRWVNRMNRRLYARFGNPLHMIHDEPAPPPEAIEIEESPPLPASESDFPPPPVPDSANIKAITTSAELAIEGQRQQNCVAAYAPAVSAGHRYIYRVLAPQRATLELVRSRTGWSLGQLKLSGNADANRSTRERVKAWLTSNELRARRTPARCWDSSE